MHRRTEHFDTLDPRARDVREHRWRERLLDIPVSRKNALHHAPRERISILNGNRRHVNTAWARTRTWVCIRCQLRLFLLSLVTIWAAWCLMASGRHPAGAALKHVRTGTKS